MFSFGCTACLETHASFRLRLIPLQRFDYAKCCFTITVYKENKFCIQIIHLFLFHYLLGPNFVDAVESKSVNPPLLLFPSVYPFSVPFS